MDAPTTAQTTYYVIATIGVLVATVINLILVNRNKPDKIKSAVNAAVQPVVERLEEIETVQGEQSAKLSALNMKTANIENELSHRPNQESLNALQQRITRMMNKTSENTAVTRAMQTQLAQLNQFLLEHGRG